MALEKMVNDIFEESRKKTNKLAIKYINENFSRMIELLKSYEKEATEYMEKRDTANEKVYQVAMDVFEQLQQWKKEPVVQVKIMSSVMSKTNLLGESDIDFGILLNNFDKLEQVIDGLEKLKFVKTRDHNSQKPEHTYTSLEKKVDGVEIELKIRNINFIKNIIKLHDILDNDLSTAEQKYITYGKFLLKQNKKVYTRFKCLVFENYSSTIDDATLFESSSE